MGTSRSSKNLIYKAMGKLQYVGAIAKRGASKMMSGMEKKAKEMDKARMMRDEEAKQSSGYYKSKALKR